MPVGSLIPKIMLKEEESLWKINLARAKACQAAVKGMGRAHQVVLPRDVLHQVVLPRDALQLVIRAGYLKQLDTVNRLREEYDAEIDRLRTREYQHLLTFTESSHQRYEQFIEEQMESREEELGKAEEELTAWFRHFRADEVPRSPDPSPRSVRGGGISKGFSRSGSARSRSSTPPERRYAMKRGRITRYRLKADEVPLGLDLCLEPPSPDKSIARLSSVRSRSHTYSRSPDSEFDQYLDEHREQYNKEQEENVGKYGLPAVEDVPEV
ncbi:hypothetical protein PRZ48_011492 [Zasmidium cellare]|uniref:Uncharacterized protein n=1 Tax=Zasmidium cellare TaxID=395010 RepID=A0ABR0E6I0_ZASCE|nr:hypothetical protein PRZ48_011492 [Zasmidium cellare]